ncbi:MAG: AraC-like DNA-binding protein [Flavobacteriaceae bacterium]
MYCTFVEYMMQKKPILEKVTPNFDSSLLVKKHEVFLKTNIPFWHFHPEIELVYVNRGKGKRHIGNHISYFNNSQLVLIGSNLPHVGYLDRLTTNGSETLIQFKPDFLGKEFFKIPEMNAIEGLLERAKKGIRFNIEIKKRIGVKIEALVELEGAHLITSFLEILNDLATTDDYTLLNVNGFAFESNKQDNNKIEVIYKHINEHFNEHISLDEIAELASMTVPAFCRYFKKSTGKTFTKLVNEHRIVHATKLLAESNISIADISFECGFNNFSYFNKVFKEFTGKTALKYRSEIKNLIQ